MGWPQIVMIIIYATNLGIGLAKHGEPQSDYNFWSIAIAVTINVILLTCGGFWH